MSTDLSDLDAAGLLAAAAEAERAARLAEVHKLEVLAAWAAVHSADPTQGPEGRVARRVGNVLRQVGGEGTPGVQDFCLGEIALSRGAGVMATQHLLADVLDHPTPYDHGDGEDGRDPPPGQTGSHNSGPLGRRHHRWKTHAGYQARQCGEGRYVWLTPHGLGFLIDHTGTHLIHPEKARMILDAPPGVDIYPM